METGTTAKTKSAKAENGTSMRPERIAPLVGDARSAGDIGSTKKPGAISAPQFAILTVPLKNAAGSPLVVHAFSEKARNTMKEAQEAGSVGRKNRKKDPKDFDAAYQGARHISRDGWDGVTCATFRNAMISACRLVGFKMTIGKLSVFVEADGNSQVGTPLVRVYGEPVPFEAAVRNASGVADIRIRPRWDEWTAKLRVRYDREQFSDEDVVNLIVRAGAQCGICEGRPDSSNSFGQGWGLFEIDMSQPIELFEVPAPKIEFMRSADTKQQTDMSKGFTRSK